MQVFLKENFVYGLKHLIISPIKLSRKNSYTKHICFVYAKLRFYCNTNKQL